MGIWQVQIWGEGFIRGGKKSSFELGGIVEASGVDDAFVTAVNLAKRDHPELSQAEHPFSSGAVINTEEIQEFPYAPKELVGEVEIFWDVTNGA